MIQWLNHASLAIKDFPMGDPHERTFPVYLPPDYNPKREDPYPVIFMLAGFGSRGAKYIWDESVYTPSLPQQLDKAIQEKSMPAVILVFPDGGSKLGCSQYINSPAIGNYMDYIAEELVQFIDKQFHTYKNAAYRGIAGHSSGGFGALIMGMLRPESFQFICSSAGDSFYEISLLPYVNVVIDEIAKAGGVAEFLTWYLQQPNPGACGARKFETMLTLAMAPCFAPNLKKPNILGDVFFDTYSGEIIDEIWEKYLQWDPIRMIERHQQALHSLKWLHLAAGLQDEHALHLGHRQIAKKLKQYQIPYHLEEYPGTHSGHNWRFVERLTLMLQKMQVLT